MRPRALIDLRPGTRFRVSGSPDLVGRLIKATESRAVVQLDAPTREVEIETADGNVRRFAARRTHVTSWSAATLVLPIGYQPLNDKDPTMPRRKKTETPTETKTTRGKKTAAPQAAKKPKREPAPKAPGKLSALDAAAKVLAEAGQPLAAREMIEAMAAKGYWTSPGGATPHATLYAAITREIAQKGAAARFAKVDRGQFTLQSPVN